MVYQNSKDILYLAAYAETALLTRIFPMDELSHVTFAVSAVLVSEVGMYLTMGVFLLGYL